MISAPVIHQAFFFLSMLFGLNTPMIGQQAVVEIYPADKSGSITYQYVVTSEEHADHAKSALKRLHSAKSFGKGVDFMKLQNKTFTSEEGELHVKVMFRYKDEKALLDRLGFQRNAQGEFLYLLLEKETLLDSNGEKQGEDQVVWSAESDNLYLEISGVSMEAKEKASAVKLGQYWEKQH
jgi:hypothetical protein